MEVRYTEGPDEVTVAPAGHPSFQATRGEWVDVPDEVAGRGPRKAKPAKGEPGEKDYDPGDPGDLGLGLIAQGWEVKTAARGAKSEKE